MKLAGLSRPHLLSSLRWRLSTAISGVVLLSTVACVAVAVVFLNRSLTDRANQDLRHTLNGVGGYMRTQRGDLLGTAKVLASDQAIINGVERGNRQGLIIHLIPYYADLNVDVMDVIDANGRALVRMENTAAHGDSVSSYPGIEAALAAHDSVGLESDLSKKAGLGYALRATVPIRASDGSVVGAVVVGRQLGSLYASRIGSALNAQINLIAGGQLTGTTITDSRGLTATGITEPSAILDRVATGQTSIATANDGGQTSLSGIYPLTDPNGSPVGAIEVVSRLTPIYDLIKQLSFLLIGLGAVIVGLGTLLALAIARRLTRRLLKLEESASRMAEASQSDAPLQSLHPTLELAGDDEVASLARSLSAMMTSLDERMIANANLYEAAQARVRELTGLAEIARLLTGESPVRETLGILSEHVVRLIGSAGAGILLPGDERQPLIFGGYGLPASYEVLMHNLLAESKETGHEIGPQMAMRTGEVVWSRLDRVPDHASPALQAQRQAAAALQWRGSTSVPLRVQGRTVGSLTCYTTSSTPFSESDLGLLRTVGDQVAVAIENARLYAESRDVAALEERARLARELHDSVTQALFSMTLHARTAEMAMERGGINDGEVLGQSIKELQELTRAALAEMRALIFELRPGALGEEGLAAALRKHAAAVSARERLSIEVEAPAERLGMDAESEEQLYRVSQEALHNVVKHAGATHVLIRLNRDEHGLLLEIVDDGNGFDQRAVPPGHLGLGTMSDRVKQVGGRLEIFSVRGKGTTVRAEMKSPVAPEPPVASRQDHDLAGSKPVETEKVETK